MPKLSDAELDSRRRQIVQAAFALFATKGFHRATMRDIYREAACSPGAVYNYFPTKEAVIQAVIGQEGGQNAVFVDALKNLQDISQVVERLNRWAEYELDEPEGQRQRQLHVQFWGEVISNQTFVEDARVLFGGFRQALAETVKLGQQRGEINPSMEPEAVARIIISFYLGMEIQASYEEHFEGAPYLDVIKALITGNFYQGPPESSR